MTAKSVQLTANATRSQLLKNHLPGSSIWHRVLNRRRVTPFQARPVPAGETSYRSASVRSIFDSSNIRLLPLFQLYMPPAHLRWHLQTLIQQPLNHSKSRYRWDEYIQPGVE